MYYNNNLKQLNIGLCVIIFICAFLSMLKIIAGEFITKMILVGLSLQQITLAYNEYKLKKTHRAVFSLFVAILIGIVFIKISK
ncbi:MAG: hypothetical protein E6902_08950 [Paeniclostridium sordellii]|uniref:Uncharacterized protein n=1 Tax=Paeniclostridium hominis TaxID=2764329 RepID=A0ABR7K342_9FIRM|nr:MULTISPECIES: hypothetical protein [Paeniclostridium]MBC6003407.1 hypothetical protein [Paeniclostridium hominis]MDU1539732.1 hypothetical protein [Paeniclostridium sordellii]